jgi:hypothetical protein
MMSLMGRLRQHGLFKRGDAWTAGGWAYLHDSTPSYPRDSVITTGEGSDWSDYHYKTRFYAEGGGDNWYHAMLLFRVQEIYGNGNYGKFYRLDIKTPKWPGGNRVYLLKIDDDGTHFVAEVVPPFGVINDYDNIVEVQVIGGQIEVAINSAWHTIREQTKGQ